MTDLRDAMQQRGLTPPSDLEPGKFSRFPSNGRPSDRSGWCLLFPDGEGAVFGDHRGGWSETWQASRSEPMTAEQRRAWRKQVADAKRKAQAEREAEHQAAAKEAARIWEQAGPADPDHPYLLKKQVQPFGIRQDGQGRLVIPVFGPDGAIQSIQHISGDGSKRFLRNGRMAAGRFWLRKDGARILVGEGYATAASIAEALPDAAVAMAFSAGNLLAVAESIRKEHPQAEIVICGDRDESGIGQAKAEEAARGIDAAVVISPAPTDFNDLAVQQGLNAVREALGQAKAPAPRPALKLDDGAWPEALDAAIEHLARGDQVFDYGGALVAIATDGSFPVTAPWVCTLLERRFKAVKYDKRSAGYQPARVPLEFAQRLLAMREAWAFPRLEAITTHRILRPDGTVIDRHGLDRATGVYLHHQGEWPPIPTDIREAVKTLWFPLSQMPFDSPADAGAALGLLLTALQRPGLDLAPMHLVSSPTFGTGKSLVGTVASLLSGSGGEITTMGSRPEEAEKAILAALLAGRGCILLDNLSGSVGGDHLAAALTSTRYRGRILGQTAEISVPTRTLWVGTGINIYPTADLVRRAITVKLDAKTERPELREYSFHPGAWTQAHLPEIQAAALAVLRYARPQPGPKLGSFTAWDSQVRQAVLTLIADGLTPCPMGDPLDTITRERQTDPEIERLGTLLQCWHAFNGERPVTVADLVSRVKAANDEAFLAVLDEVGGDGRGNINARRTGWYLRRHEGRIVGGLQIAKGREGAFGVQWRVAGEGFKGFTPPNSTYTGNCQSDSNDSYIGGGENDPDNPRNPTPCPACAGEGCSWCESTGVRS